MKPALYLFSLSLALASSAAFAVNTSVDFPIGQKNGSFYCTYDGQGQIHMSTDNVKVRGFCAGDPGVTIPGQFNANSDDVKDFYFSIKKSATQSGKVNIENVDGDMHAITCISDRGGKKPYPYGASYC